MPTRPTDAAAWPSLPLEGWSDTCATLHRWLQIVGKVRLAQAPWINHSWHATFYLTANGLTTSPIPYGDRTFQADFDFMRHRLALRHSGGATTQVPLEPQSVATFYGRFMAALREIGVEVRIHMWPNEVPDSVRFDQDEVHASYDRDSAHRFWRILAQSERVFAQFRARFAGKSSPVHVFWGAPDLALTRFSGRRAPEHPGGIPNLPDRVVRDAYSHEVSSCGFWPGGGPVPYPAFYAYAYPEPEGFATAAVQPAEAFYSEDLGEFILPYDAVRTAAAPDEVLLAFLQATYEAVATLGRWDREALEYSGPGYG
ncbi:MAG TPA: DUF5996 family protein [Thermoanaerobaculia bacterium]|nr:DUF5996 family protein [Thermoanaerobaculia bacterium]